MRKLVNYNDTNMKTVRTDIDGRFTIKLDKGIELQKGCVVEVKGDPEIYKLQNVVKELPNNPSFIYYLNRGYDELMEFKMVKCLNLSNLTLKGRKEECDWLREEFKEEDYKENYELNGIGFMMDGRLSKNQIVRLNTSVVKITELIKPETKGGRVIVKGEEVERVVVDSTYRLYEKDTFKLLGEYEEYGDWLLAGSRNSTRVRN